MFGMREGGNGGIDTYFPIATPKTHGNRAAFLGGWGNSSGLTPRIPDGRIMFLWIFVFRRPVKVITSLRDRRSDSCPRLYRPGLSYRNRAAYPRRRGRNGGRGDRRGVVRRSSSGNRSGTRRHMMLSETRRFAAGSPAQQGPPSGPRRKAGPRRGFAPLFSRVSTASALARGCCVLPAHVSRSRHFSFCAWR